MAKRSKTLTFTLPELKELRKLVAPKVNKHAKFKRIYLKL